MGQNPAMFAVQQSEEKKKSKVVAVNVCAAKFRVARYWHQMKRMNGNKQWRNPQHSDIWCQWLLLWRHVEINWCVKKSVLLYHNSIAAETSLRCQTLAGDWSLTKKRQPSISPSMSRVLTSDIWHDVTVPRCWTQLVLNLVLLLVPSIWVLTQYCTGCRDNEKFTLLGICV